MLQAVNDAVVNAADYVFGWILYLPRDLRLVVVAVLTSAVLAWVRKWTTDQEWLGRASRDQKRLKELMRQARAAKDKDARRRHKQARMLIKLKSLRFEAKPLLAAILPVAILATWAFGRLAYEPPVKGQTLELRLYVPTADIGSADRPYLLPQEGIEVAQTDTGGVVQDVVRDSYPQPGCPWDKANAALSSKLHLTPELTGVARWRIKAVGEKDRYTLRLRHKGRTCEKGLVVDGRHHPSAYDACDGDTALGVELAMEPVRLLGQVGGVLFLQPWLVAYLLIAIPFVYVFKAVCRIY